MLKISSIVSAVPAVLPLLSQKARYIYFAQQLEAVDLQIEPIKSFEDFAKRLGQLVQAVYDGKLAGGFVDAMAALISRQITLAYREAWKEKGDGGKLPDYLSSSAEEMILGQYDFVDGLYKSIVDARIDGTPIDPLLTRADQWANQYNSAYETASLLITAETGGNKKWLRGATEKGCPTCIALDGVVAPAKLWLELGVKPKNPPNGAIVCGGWNCDCSLDDTDEKETPNARQIIMDVMA